MSRARKAAASSWDPSPPSRFAEFYAACQARYTPPTLLERLISRVPDAISTSCRDCGTNFLQALGGPLECHVCGAREIDTLREELADAVERAEEAEQERDARATEAQNLYERLGQAHRDLDDRDREIERLQLRISCLGGAQ